MSLADELKQANKRAIGCKLCFWILNFSNEDSQALKEALSNSSIGHTTIADILTKNGNKINESAVRRHRRSHT